MLKKHGVNLIVSNQHPAGKQINFNNFLIGITIVSIQTERDDIERNLAEESRHVNFVMKDPNLLLRVISEGTIALGEGYMNDAWNSDSVELMTKRLWNAFGTRANPIHKIRDWVYLNASEFPWDDDSTDSWLTSKARNEAIKNF
jgi:hypothetical protein